MNAHRTFAVMATMLTALLVSACSVAPVEIMADYPGYDSINGVGSASDIVVSGIVLDSRVEYLYPDTVDSEDPITNPQAGVPGGEINDIPPVVITISSVQVSDVIKGNVRPGDVIEVSQLGGEINGETYTERDTTLVDTLDATIVLFLAAHDNAPYDLVNPEQGLLLIEGDSLKAVSESTTIEIPDTLDSLRAEIRGK